MGRSLLIFLLIAALAAALRVPDLAARPMHTDEAVHALKFAELLERGSYRYDPVEFHGPTLNYLTLIPAWLASAATITAIDETTLRSVPVAFGLGLVLLLPLLTRGLGPRVVLAAALLTAMSPAMVFFSRFYVQEMLVVSFTFAAIASGYRYLGSRHVGWAMAAGLSVGLMHATKETAIIALAAMALALTCTVLAGPGGTAAARASLRRSDLRHVAVALATAVLVSALLYSSFLSHPAGVVDSYRTYGTYLPRAVEDGLHVHPWYYYLQLLALFRGPDGPIWTEALILALAGGGLVVAIRGPVPRGLDPALLRFLALYATAMLLVYSAIPYKTPWNLLGFWHGLILLAGVGLVALCGWPTPTRLRSLGIAILALGCAHLTYQAYLSSHRYHSDPGNPYVYSQPGADVLRIIGRIEEVAVAHPDGRALRIDVVYPGGGYWPLPWYLRAFSQVGWWQEVPMDTPVAPVILAAPELEAGVLERLYRRRPPGQRSLYVPLFDGYAELRPRAEVRGYVAKELWDRSRGQPPDTPAPLERE